MSRATEIINFYILEKCSGIVLRELSDLYDIDCSVVEEGISASFQKFWNLVLTGAIKISKKTIELTKGVSIVTTGYRVSSIAVPKAFRGKGITDSKSGKMIVVSVDGESAALVEF